MVDAAKYTIGLVGLMLITAFASYMVIDTGKTLSCPGVGGWTLQSDGKYLCKTATTLRYSYCSSVSNTAAGRINYYCKEATLKQLEDRQSTISVPTYLCKYGKECVLQ